MSAQRTFLALAALTLGGTATASPVTYDVTVGPSSLSGGWSVLGPLSGSRSESFTFSLGATVPALTRDTITGYHFASWGYGGGWSGAWSHPGKGSWSHPTSVPEPDGLLLASTGLAAVLGFGLLRGRRGRAD